MPWGALEAEAVRRRGLSARLRVFCGHFHAHQVLQPWPEWHQLGTVPWVRRAELPPRVSLVKRRDLAIKYRWPSGE